MEGKLSELVKFLIRWIFGLGNICLIAFFILFSSKVKIVSLHVFTIHNSQPWKKNLRLKMLPLDNQKEHPFCSHSYEDLNASIVPLYKISHSDIGYSYDRVCETQKMRIQARGDFFEPLIKREKKTSFLLLYPIWPFARNLC